MSLLETYSLWWFWISHNLCALPVGGGSGTIGSNGTRSAPGPGSPLTVKRDVSPLKSGVYCSTCSSLPSLPSLSVPLSLPLSTLPISTLSWLQQSSQWRGQSLLMSSKTRSTFSSITYPPLTYRRKYGLYTSIPAPLLQLDSCLLIQ